MSGEIHFIPETPIHGLTHKIPTTARPVPSDTSAAPHEATAAPMARVKLTMLSQKAFLAEHLGAVGGGDCTRCGRESADDDAMAFMLQLLRHHCYDITVTAFFS